MKPQFKVNVRTLDKAQAAVNVLFDTSSFYTIIREDKLPGKTGYVPEPQTFGTAAKGGVLQIDGAITLYIEYNGKTVRDDVLVSSQLKTEMILGARTMQSWDIVIDNKNGQTEVIFRKDIHDPDITEVD